MIAFLLACTGPAPLVETDSPSDTAQDTGWWPDPDATTDPFADAVIAFTPGEASGFGADQLPGIVTAAPKGHLAGTPSVDVVSLGREGDIVLELVDYVLVDGPGVDLLVFENPMPAWKETGFVAVSEDGVTWLECPCAPLDEAGGFPGCAGTQVVYAGPGAADPTDAATAGGDRFDLADLGVTEARFVRVRDSGQNPYDGATGGFDLDAIAAVNGRVAE